MGLLSFPNARRAVKRKPRRISDARRGSLPIICEFDGIRPTKAAQRSNGGRDLGPVEFGGHFCAHKLEKDANASFVV
jgi:hypothetical protein